MNQLLKSNHRPSIIKTQKVSALFLSNVLLLGHKVL